MTVKELREKLEQYKGTEMDDAIVLVFDCTYNDNPVNSKIQKIEEYRNIGKLAIYCKSTPDVVR